MAHEEIWEGLAELRSRDNLLLLWLNDTRRQMRELQAGLDGLLEVVVGLKRAIRPAGWWAMLDEDALEEDDAVADDGARCEEATTAGRTMTPMTRAVFPDSNASSSPGRTGSGRPRKGVRDGR